MKTPVTVALISLSLMLLPMTAQAGFCGSGKKNKRHYYQTYTPHYWLGQTTPVRYYYYSYPTSMAYY